MEPKEPVEDEPEAEEVDLCEPDEWSRYEDVP